MYDLLQTINQFKLNDYFPKPENLFFSKGPLVLSAFIGMGYGYTARLIYPQAGFSPLHYGVLFPLAYQIKIWFTQFFQQFKKFMQAENASELKPIPFQDRLRVHVWKIVAFAERCQLAIDQFFKNYFGMRSWQTIQFEKTKEATFAETCRHRVWQVFKSTLLNAIVSGVAYTLTTGMGFTLANSSSMMIFTTPSLIKDILLVPILHHYSRFFDNLAGELREDSKLVKSYRAVWLKQLLPAL